MRIVTLLFILLAFITNGIGASNNYIFEHLGVKDGLSQNAVTCIYKDSYGYMWFGTNHGLNKYDGYNFQVFKPDYVDTTSISSLVIVEILEDENNTLWVATTGGINKFDRETNSFERFYHIPNDKSTIHGNFVTDIFVDSKQNLWVCTNEGLSKINVNNGKLERVIDDFFITAIQQKDSTLYIATKGGLFFKSTLQGEVSMFETSIEAESISLFLDNNNHLWAGTDAGELYWEENDVFHSVKIDSPDYNLTSNRYKVEQHQDSVLWVSTDKDGIVLLHAKTKKVLENITQNRSKYGISGNGIVDILIDDNMILWVGNYQSGIDYFHPVLDDYRLVNNSFSQGMKLTHNIVNSILKDDEGNIWIGTNYGLNKTNESFKNIQGYSNELNGLDFADYTILCAAQTKNLGVVFGTFSGGIQFLNKNSLTKEIENEFSDRKIKSLFVDSKENLWVGSIKNGVSLISENGEVTHFSPRRFINPSITSFTEDNEGNIWVGTSYGLTKFNYGVQVEHFSDSEKNPISNNRITCLHKDNYGNVWIGTDYGLNIYIPEKDTMLVVLNEPGISNSIIKSIVQSQSKNVIITTLNTIFEVEFSNESLKAIPILKSSESGIEEFSVRAALITQDNVLYLGTKQGLLRYENNTSKHQIDPKIVAITKFQVKDIASTENNITYKEKAAHIEAGDLEIDYNENIIKVEFAALTYVKAQNVMYKYRLHGFDENWQISSADKRNVTYTNLSPGAYIFEVYASTGNDIWSEEPTQIEFTVLPPWWLSWWFIFLTVLIIGSLIVLYNRHRVNLIVKRNKELERKVDERTEELRKANIELTEQKDTISHTNKELRKLNDTKDKFFSIIAHDLRNPMNIILNFSELLKQSLDSLDMHKVKMFVGEINTSSGRMYNLLESLLDWARTQTNKVEVFIQDVSLNESIQEVVHLVTTSAEEKNITIQNDSAIDIVVPADENMIKTVFRNILTNAIKFTPNNGEIKINKTFNDKSASIKISDSGIGMSSQQIDNLFKIDKNDSRPGTNNEKGSGLGLIICKEFIEQNRGTITVTSAENNGTTFTIELPLKHVSDKKVEPQEEQAKVIQTNNYLNLKEIVIVDDDTEFLQFLETTLEKKYKVYTASSAALGEELIRKVIPDIIISDVNMPEYNGYELCKNIKKNDLTSHIPFILLTAQTDNSERIEGYESGADEYITKPFNKDVLLARLENFQNKQSFVGQQFKEAKAVDIAEYSTTKPNDAFMTKAMEIVEENVGNSEFSVELLAKELGMSRSLLYKKLMALINTTPFDFIKSIRLKRSLSLLDAQELNISEIAYEVGFNTPRFFSKYFKDEFGLTPSEYLKKNK